MAWNIEEVHYDMLELLPIHVCQNVFTYLNGKDVIQASLGNKEWYKFAAECPQIGKLKLAFNPENQHQLANESLELLKNSRRKYQNIELEMIEHENSTCILEIIAERAGSWKSVVTKHCNFEEAALLQILRVIEPSVEELVFFENLCIGIFTLEANPEWTFPCLNIWNVSTPDSTFSNTSFVARVSSSSACGHKQL